VVGLKAEPNPCFAPFMKYCSNLDDGRRPMLGSGATIDAMMKATGWQQHSVRGFLAGVVRKRLNLKLSSDKVGGKRIYQIKSSNGGKATVRAAQRLPA
jgi:Protein of unknown function (DUF3489)